ncbi:hypothetical protein C1H46_008615 [Malus baccata]|uniref:Protein kinase domain-containing protein n=1 Tax=Malus baccata TaxID=106549 RepID=A0A540N407_MALBA|nr:hypothetical protein C1H46_008615 [Malus baccata]
MEREKLIRSSVQQLQTATDNFTNLLGSGGFGAVYKGIFGNGVLVTVKVLNRSSVKRIEEQLKAFMVSIWSGFMVTAFFERNLRALSYEYRENGWLDKLSFSSNEALTQI